MPSAPVHPGQACSGPHFRRAWSTVAGCAVAAIAAWTAACSGPRLRLDTDGETFVDGRRQSRTELPFRYYGTTRIDVWPNRTESAAAPFRHDDYAAEPRSELVAIEPPVPAWAFPFDFPGELLHRAFAGRQDQQVQVHVTRVEEPVVDGVPPPGLDQLRGRAAGARITR